MKNLIDWLKFHWKTRAFRVSTICALILIYLELFHHIELNSMLDKLIDNPIVITAIIGWLVGTNKF